MFMLDSCPQSHGEFLASIGAVIAVVVYSNCGVINNYFYEDSRISDARKYLHECLERTPPDTLTLVEWAIRDLEAAKEKLIDLETLGVKSLEPQFGSTIHSATSELYDSVKRDLLTLTVMDPTTSLLRFLEDSLFGSTTFSVFLGYAQLRKSVVDFFGNTCYLYDGRVSSQCFQSTIELILQAGAIETLCPFLCRITHYPQSAKKVFGILLEHKYLLSVRELLLLALCVEEPVTDQASFMPLEVLFNDPIIEFIKARLVYPA